VGEDTNVEVIIGEEEIFHLSFEISHLSLVIQLPSATELVAFARLLPSQYCGLRPIVAFIARCCLRHILLPWPHVVPSPH
jgi:hypothetical protein